MPLQFSRPGAEGGMFHNHRDHPSSLGFDVIEFGFACHGSGVMIAGNDSINSSDETWKEQGAAYCLSECEITATSATIPQEHTEHWVFW